MTHSRNKILTTFCSFFNAIRVTDLCYFIDITDISKQRAQGVLIYSEQNCKVVFLGLKYFLDILMNSHSV